MKHAILIGICITLFACAKPPKSCSEALETKADQVNAAVERVKQMSTDGLVHLDLQSSAIDDWKRIGTLLSTTDKAPDAPSAQLSTERLDSMAQWIKALPTGDKQFFFSYHTSEDRKWTVVQISIEARLNQLSSNTEIRRLLKTGYFDAEGNLVCMLTPDWTLKKVSLVNK